MPSMSSLFDLSGKCAVVTGAGRGLGRGCAQALAEAGAEVIAVSRTASELDSLIAEIKAQGGQAKAHICDVTDAKAIDEVLADLSRVDVLVNNAGGNKPQRFLDIDIETFDWMIDLNLRSLFIFSQKVACLMQQQNNGSIIHMSSQMGHVGGIKRSVYCMTKHGLEGLTKAMAIDLAEWNIRVNTVAPTFVETPLTRPFLKTLNLSKRFLTIFR